MKRLMTLAAASAFTFIASSLNAVAQTVVVATDGEPMVGTVVLGADGAPIGIVNENGLLPAVAAARYPLTLSCMGFERTAVAEPVDTVVMTPVAHALSEVTVSADGRPGMYIVCYGREVSCITDGVDSIHVNSQFMADYMLPAFDGAKCKTWDTPRTLSEEVKVGSTLPEVSREDMLVWRGAFRGLARLTAKPEALPDSLGDKDCATRKGKKGCESVMRLTPAGLNVATDMLADRKDHTFKLPGFFSMLGFGMAIDECWEQSTYAHADDRRYNAANLSAKAVSFRVNCDGKGWKSFFPSGRTNITIHTYLEIYPVEIAYYSKDEAKALAKEKPERALEVPAAAR